jgi:dipeptidyl aminopeptidase/acylaminoacyl peptidase
MQVLMALRGKDAEELTIIRCDHLDAGTIARFHPGTNRATDVITPNKPLFDSLALAQPEEIWVSSSEGHRVQAWLLKPPAAGGVTPPG